MAEKYNKLAGKHVLVIGGTSGIGFCVVEASLASGASVTISSSSIARVNSTIEKLKKDFPSSIIAGYACDLSAPSLEANIESLFSQTGKVDHIVFTAGDKLTTITLQDNTLETMIRQGQVRFFAPLLVAKVGSRYLNAGPQSSITLTTGSVAERPAPNWSVVASYAAGLHGMTRNLALDLKPIRVNCVAPGPVSTEMWDDHFHDQKQKEAALQGMAGRSLTGLVGQPEDVAELYLWLMKDKNVTGTIASSDSGVRLV